ncbi:putative methyltransferase NSUN7 [Nothobranchius furzeri]
MSDVPTKRLLDDNDASRDDRTLDFVKAKEVQDHQNPRQQLSSLLSPPRPSPRCKVSPPSDQVFLQAAAIFHQLHKEKPVAHQLLHYEKKTNTVLLESGKDTTQKQAYQLAFNTLKYQDLLEDVITDSCFATAQHIHGDLLPLAMVMLFDFQDRKFVLHKRPTEDDQEAIQAVRDLERSLQKCKTKLAAALGRYRVKNSLQSVSCFLSDSVRTKGHQEKCLPIYAWINTLKTSLDEVCDALKEARLSEVKTMTELTDSAFCRDPLCADALVLSRHLHTFLQQNTLTNTHLLNIQDRSVCVPVSVLQPLQFDKGDVLLAGSFSALTMAHAAVVAAARSGRVLVCGADHTPSQVEEIQQLLTQMGIKNVRVLSEAFYNLNEGDAIVQRLRVIMVLPQCSSSALNDPVNAMHSEHGDWNLLPDLSRGSISKSNIYSLTNHQARLLGHALSFPKVHTVVYCTRSVYPEENEQLVRRVLEKIHTHPKLLPFRVTGPLFPDDDPQPGDATNSKFFRLQPSQFTNGCFVARLSRQTDPTKVESVQDVLARAVAKGLLGDIVPEPLKTGKKRKTKKKQTVSATSKPSSPSSQEEAEREPVDGRDSEEPSEREEKDEGNLEVNEANVGEDQKIKGEKKKKKKQKMVKKHLKQTKNSPTDAKQSHKKKTKKKEDQPQSKKKQTRMKPRRIPRLTLALISSANPSNHLSPITALAHKISGNPGMKPSCPSTPLPTASKRQNTPPEEAERTLKDD